MLNQLNKSAEKQRKKYLIYAASCTGIIFWFIAAFPFSHRGESFSWAAQIEKFSFWQSLSFTFPSVVTFRPLSQSLAWILYTISGGEIYLVQFFNFFLLIFAFIVIIKSSAEKGYTSLLLMISGFVFISAFYYLFHLHGIFYSPLILFTAYLLLNKNKIEANNKFLTISFFIALVTAAIHTYALAIFTLFLVGLIFSNRDKINWGIILLLVISFILLIIITFSNPGNTSSLTLSSMFDNTRNSFFNAEVSGRVSPFVAGLVLISLLWIKSKKLFYSIITLAVAATVFFYFYSLPVFFLLILSVIVKLIINKDWVILFLLGSLIMFPAVVETGAPTKSALLIPFIMFVIADNDTGINSIVSKVKKYQYALVISFFLLTAFLTRLNVWIPFLNNITDPILAEREKTFQLDEIVDWYFSSEYIYCKLILLDEQVPLNQGPLNISRKIIPPTVQPYLNQYIDARKEKLNIRDNDCSIYVCFGDQDIDGNNLVFKTFLNNAGTAKVYH